LQESSEDPSTMPAQQLASDPKAKIASAIPYNPSSQHLMKANDYSELDLPSNDFIGQKYMQQHRTPHHITKTQWLTVVILFFVNLINYMDRLTIAGKTKIEVIFVCLYCK
jgi:hypothetical protein